VALSLAPIDRWTLGYLAYAAVMLAARFPQEDGLRIAAGYAALGVLAVAAPSLRRRGGIAAFFAEFYPLVAAVGLYTAIGAINAAAGVSHDGVVQRWEQAAFGGQPSRDWIRAAPWPWLSWLLHAGYLSYYFILAGAPLALWVSGRRDGARRVALAIMIAFYACYAAFHLFPVAGPRYAFPLAENAATATAIARFTQRLLDGGAAWGTAFPSSHVAVSLAAAGATVQEWGGPGIVLLCAALLLTVGTVYGQVHYALDAFAGALVAAAVLAAMRAAKIHG
jgi:membrane-associated phospholipid phosphatase